MNICFIHIAASPAEEKDLRLSWPWERTMNSVEVVDEYGQKNLSVAG